MGTKKFPCLFHGRLIWLVPRSWPGARCLYEKDLAGPMNRGLERADWFVDVGAHFGLWSLFADRIFGGKRLIHAFEPSAAFSVLAENALGHKNLVTHRCAISHQKKKAEFFGQGMATSGSMRESITRINRDHQPDVAITPVEIECWPLDEMTKKFAGNGLIKIDCEGHEFKVLQGAVETIRQGPRLIIEVHPHQLKEEGDSPEKIFDFLKQQGYEVQILAPRITSVFTILACPRRA